MLISFTQLLGKLVFVGLNKNCHCETSPQTGRGNPPVEWYQVTITTKNRNVSPFCREIIDTFPL